MSDAQNNAWWGDPGKPGSAQEARWKQQNLAPFTLNCGVTLILNRRTGHLIKGFWDDLEAVTGYSLKDAGAADDWGFNNRPNRNNPRVKSNHSWGNAADGNAEENPNTHGHLVTNMPVEWVRKLAEKWGLRWGGDWDNNPATAQSTYDAMHVEYVRSPEEIPNYPKGATPAPPIISTLGGLPEMFVYTVNGARMFFNGQVVYDCSDTNFYNELTRPAVKGGPSPVPDIGARNAAFHNTLIDLSEGKLGRAGRA